MKRNSLSFSFLYLKEQLSENKSQIFKRGSFQEEQLNESEQQALKHVSVKGTVQAKKKQIRKHVWLKGRAQWKRTAVKCVLLPGTVQSRTVNDK